jgi:hypothetical protein
MMLISTTSDDTATKDVNSVRPYTYMDFPVDPATPVCLPCLPGMYCPSALPDYPIACPGWSANINNYWNALNLMILHPEWTGLTEYTKCPDVSAAGAFQAGRRLIGGGDVSPAAPVNPLEVYRQHMWVVM